MKVAIQGGNASFHDIAARDYFGKDINTIQCDSFRKLCEVLKEGQADYAVMAIENSIAGSILSNYTLLHEFNFYIVGEIQLRIEQNLIALPGTNIKDIQKVRSHYMALLQCRDFLNQYPHIQVEEYHDTAESAKVIRENNEEGVAAIAGRYAAELYQLELIAEGIETEKKNYTRFMVLSRNKKERVGHINKATICFQLPDKIGALSDVLRIIVDNKINLTKIQSIPIIGKPNEYTFYVDCEFEDYEKFKQTIAIKPLVQELKILGEYEKGKMIHDYSKS